jgi:hypothetical protein
MSTSTNSPNSFTAIFIVIIIAFAIDIFSIYGYAAVNLGNAIKLYERGFYDDAEKYIN